MCRLCIKLFALLSNFSVAILLSSTTRQAFVLVKQFRPGKLLYLFNLARVSLREKCPNTELFLVWIWKIRTRNNSVFEHFLRSVYFLHTWRKVSVHETFKTLSCYFLNVLFTFSLRPLSRGSTVTTLFVLLISYYLKWISFHLFFPSFFTRILCRF